MGMPSIVLVIGDSLLGRNTVNSAKNKYSDFLWTRISGSDTPDEIRLSCSLNNFSCDKKIVLITDFPNKKDFREFILDLVDSSSEDLKFVLWDNNEQIKIDPKKGINKTWQEWIDELNKKNGFVLVDNGSDFADNDTSNSSKYVQDLFSKKNLEIDSNTAKIFVELVGKNRGLIFSEVQKICLIAPKKINKDFVLESVYPTAKEAVLYQFGNDIDSGDLSKVIYSLEKFLSIGTDANILAHIMVTKARWNLAICHLWFTGLDYNSIKNEIVNMGKFPSVVWHNDQLTSSQKTNFSSGLKDMDNVKDFVIKTMGLPVMYVDGDSLNRGECIPMPFMADMMINYAKAIAKENKQDKAVTLNRAVNIYLECADLLKQIRYNENQKGCLYEMVKLWTNPIYCP